MLAMLSGLRPQMIPLQLLRLKKGCEINPAQVAASVTDAPASWALGKRVSRPVSSVSMTWNVSVGALRKAAQRSMHAMKHERHEHSYITTAPLGGLTFLLLAQCAADDAGCKIGMFAFSKDMPADGYYSSILEIKACGMIEQCWRMVQAMTACAAAKENHGEHTMCCFHFLRCALAERARDAAHMVPSASADSVSLWALASQNLKRHFTLLAVCAPVLGLPGNIMQLLHESWQ
jgi:hypothetical protein